jgi:hypothetical protein
MIVMHAETVDASTDKKANRNKHFMCSREVMKLKVLTTRDHYLT